jgi:putative iron-regulated protein
MKLIRFVCLVISFILMSSGIVLANSVSYGYTHMAYKQYQDSLEGALKLQQAVNLFLEKPDKKHMDIVKIAWITARVPYLQTEAFRFYGGPIDAAKTDTQAEGPEERINAWPLNEAYIDYVKGNPKAGIVYQTTIPVTPALLKSKNQQKDAKDVTTGWHAIEFLLWGQNLAATGPGVRPVSDYAKGDVIKERRREYLKQVTDLLVQDLRSLVNAWAPKKNNYAAQFKAMDEKELLGKILTGIASLSGAEMALERMNNALISGERLDSQSCFSDTTHQDFVYNAKGIRNVYLLVSPLVAKKNPALDKQIHAQLNETDRLITAIPNPYGPVLGTSKGSIEKQTVSAAVKSLQEQAVLLKQAGAVLGAHVDIVLK